jgi:hypothetical protein
LADDAAQPEDFDRDEVTERAASVVRTFWPV